MSMTETKTIYCCGCNCDTQARLTDGKEVYPHRTDLYPLPFWKCDQCGSFVGCHHKSAQRTRPLGNIPTFEIKLYRKEIHRIMDPLWKSGRISRSAIYKMIGKHIGHNYHTGEIKSVEDAKRVLAFVNSIRLPS
jgi:hypothetical protein